jgi:hypothetical protein
MVGTWVVGQGFCQFCGFESLAIFSNTYANFPDFTLTGQNFPIFFVATVRKLTLKKNTDCRSLMVM